MIEIVGKSRLVETEDAGPDPDHKGARGNPRLTRRVFQTCESCGRVEDGLHFHSLLYIGLGERRRNWRYRINLCYDCLQILKSQIDAEAVDPNERPVEEGA